MARRASDERQRQGGQSDALDRCGPCGARLDRRRFGQRAGADQIARGQRLGAILLRHGRRELGETQCRTAKRVAARPFLDQLFVLREPDLELRQLLDELGDARRRDRTRLADDERGVQAIGGDEVGGLILPVGVGTVDDLESEREPLDGLERGGRLRDARARAAPSS